MKDLIIIIAVLLVFIRCMVIFKDKLRFFATGHDKGFKFDEISALWKIVKKEKIEEPESVFYSPNLVNKAIADYLEEIRSDGTENEHKNQVLLAKLYDFRTRVSLEHDAHKGLDSSKYLDKGQKLRIILPGKGVFQSEILSNASELVIKTPTKDSIITIPSAEWIDRKINVYLWRKGDAAYVFDSFVTNTNTILGFPALNITHSNNLLRTQKRRSVRAECSIESSLYFLQKGEIDYSLVETSAGYKCIIEDISEDGALIRVGGRGMRDVAIKLQFNIGSELIMMFGIVRAVEYDKEKHESKLHFECTHLDESMRINVLSFVYNVLPTEKKEIFDAIAQTEEDKDDEDKVETDKEKEEGELEKIAELEKETSIVENSLENLVDDSNPLKNNTYTENSEPTDENDFGGFEAHADEKYKELSEKINASRG